MTLLQELNQTISELQTAVNEMVTTGRNLAEKERDYKLALRGQALRERENGTPVTMLQYVLYGQRDIAMKRFERDVAQTMYDANREFINLKKLHARILHEQAQQEWASAKYE